MYQAAYIDGKRNCAEINREYVAHYISGREGADAKRMWDVLTCIKNTLPLTGKRRIETAVSRRAFAYSKKFSALRLGRAALCGKRGSY